MSAFIDENTQYLDEAGKPIVNGKLYVGIKALDPILNPIIIYSDRALTTPLSNPQTLDSDGRSTNKIWIPGQYSFRVDNTNDVQKLIDLDAGEIQATGTTILSDAQGGNSITATASPTISSYTDGQIYILQPASNNSGATTLNVDSLGAKAVVSSGAALTGGELLAGLNYAAVYNSDNDNFDLLSVSGGLTQWSGLVTYTATGAAFGDDGMLYFSRAAGNLNNNPVTGSGNEWIAADQIRNILATGTVDAITATLIPSINVLRNGFTCRVRAIGANATTTPTFSPNGLTAKTIVKYGNQALLAGDIFGAGHEMLLVYNGSNDVWELLNPAPDPLQGLIVIGTVVDTSTGATSYDFTSIPADTKKITVMFSGVSVSGTSSIIFQLGDVGGVEVTGYLGSGGEIVGGSTGTVLSTSGFIIRSLLAANLIDGSITLSLSDPSTFTWVASGAFSTSSSARVYVTAGSKPLSAELDRVRVTTSGGTDTFDAGTINIQYEL